MNIQPNTDLIPLVGKRLIVDHVRSVRVTSIRHCTESPIEGLRDGFGGNCVEDPHGSCRGGSTAFWWPYGTDLTVSDN